MLLLPKNARLIGQGLTGSEGSRSLPLMFNYGTNIVAGVTPRKGGQEVCGIPVFNTVKEALSKVGEIDGSVQYVPPLFTKAAVFEAIDAGIKFILVGAEKIPVKDAAEIFVYAKQNRANVIGPSSIGVINPERKLKLGEIGGADPNRAFTAGTVAVISKSGGMTSEIGILLKNNGLGVSWVIGIGGDRIASTDFADLLLEFEKDVSTKASVIFGELGGTYEEKVAEIVKKGLVKKPVIAFIAGEFTSSLPSNIQFGHAGAIIEGKRGLPSEKRRILNEAGVLVADKFDDIPSLIKKSING